MNLIRKILCTAGAGCALFAAQLYAGILPEEFIDPLDGMLDSSQFLRDNRVGFLPVPVLVTEPAVGVGGGLGLIFLHDTESEQGSNKAMRPSVSGVVGLATDNGTKAGALFHYGVWAHDRIRYMGILGRASVNFDYYPFGNIALGMNLTGTYFSQQMKFRLGKTPLFAGVRYQLLDSDAELRFGLHEWPLPPLEKSSRNGALGISLEYDSRNNLFTPERGILASLNYHRFDEAFGGDFNFDDLKGVAIGYQPLSEQWLLAGRVSAERVDGDVPFYAKPYINLRGIPAMRYQGEQVAQAEVELRWDPVLRWSLLGFSGVGRAAGSGALRDADDRLNYGVGFRYLMARLYGIRMGADLAWGPDERAFYIQVGSAWMD